jgi:hypothetical protein
MRDRDSLSTYHLSPFPSSSPGHQAPNLGENWEAYYWRKYRETPHHKHKRALVLTGRKLTRLVYTLLAKNTAYAIPQTVLKNGEEVALLMAEVG